MDSSQLGQVLSLLQNRAADGVAPRRMPTSEIEQLISAAALLGEGRAQGFDDEEILGNFARGLVRERDRRLGGVDTRAAAAEAALVEGGLAADDIQAKSLGEILADEAEFGFADEKLARLAQEQQKPNDNLDRLRGRIGKVRNMREGKKREALLAKLNQQLEDKQQRQILFDLGIGRQQDPRQVDFFDPADTKGLLAAFDQDPLNPELQRLVAERAAGIEGGRRIRARNQQFEGEPLEFGRYISPTKDGQPVYVQREEEWIFKGRDDDGNAQFEHKPAERRRLQRGIQIPLRGKPGLAQPNGDFAEVMGEMIPVPRGLDKERGGFVIVNGQRKWRERGRLFDSPEGAVEFRNEDIADEIFRPQIAGIDNAERRRLAEQDRAAGASEVRRFERFERGELTPEEMEARARLDAARATNEVFVRDEGWGKKPEHQRLRNRPFEANIGQPAVKVFREPAQTSSDPNIFVDPRGKMRGAKRDAKPRNIEARPFNAVTPDDAKAAILGQLQSRKEANRAGRRERIIAANNEDAGLEAVLLGNESNLRGKAAAEAQPNIQALGQLKADRLKKDMGLQLGDQKATVDRAIRVELPDGSYRFVDAAGNDLAAPIKEQQAVNLAENLNAPDGANNAVDFVLKNQFEDRGAQFFGTDDIIGQMNDKGSGGGIEQVNIQGALRGIEEKVAAKLGIPAKRINSVQGFQAAMNAVIANEQAKGRALIRLEDGKKVRVDNPGVEEALLALKVNPAEGRAIANALKQKALAVGEQVSIPGAKHAGHDVVTGVNDPRRGGDRVEIAKDVAFQGKLLRQGIDGEAAKPFIGLQAGDPRRAGGNQVQRGMDPVELRINQEARDRANIAKKAKRGIRVKADNRGNNARIRQFQEGNVRARLRAAEADAAFKARGQNNRGRVEGARDFGGNPFIGEGQQGRARAPHPKARLKDRPVFRGDRQNMNPNPSVVEGGAENIKIPEGFRPQNSQGTRPQGPTMRTEGRNRQQMADAVMNQFTKMGADPRTKRGRRIGYGIGGGAAALATVLGLTNNQEEEQY